MNLSKANPAPLQAGKLGNVQPKTNNLVSLSEPHVSKSTDSSVQKIKTDIGAVEMPDESSNMDNILARMREMHFKDTQQGRSSSSGTTDDSKAVMNKLIADLKAQKGELKKQALDNKEGPGSDRQKEEDRSSSSDPFTPATESFDVVSSADAKEPDASNLDVAEILRVKQELAAAKSVITRQEQELAESRNLKHTIDQAMGPPSEADFSNRADMSEDTIHHLQGAFNAAARPLTARADSWHPQDDSRSDHSDVLSAGSYNRGRGIWNGANQPAYGGNFAQSLPQQSNLMDNRNVQGAWPPASGLQASQPAVSASQRVLSGPPVSTFAFEGRFADDGSQFNAGGIRRTSSQYNRPTSGYYNRASPFRGFGTGLPAITTAPMTPMGYGGQFGYQPRPIGTPLSPTASEFNGTSLSNVGNALYPVSESLFYDTSSINNECR